MKKRTLMSHEKMIEQLVMKTVQNIWIKKTVEQYGLNCPSGFRSFQKIARLAEINAPGHVLKPEIQIMEERFKQAGFARNEIANVKKWLFAEYPGIQRKIKRIPIVR